MASRRPIATKNRKGAQKVKFEGTHQLRDFVRETSFAIHKYHRNGHLEKIYENALTHRLRKQGVEVKQQHPLTVFDEDVAQLLRYLKSSRGETGLLVNFGAAKLYVKKYLMTVSEH